MRNISSFLLALAATGAAQAQTPVTLAPVATYSSGPNSYPWVVAVADVNGDGRPDIVTANNVSNSAGVLLGLAGGGFGVASAYPSGGTTPVAVAVADVNGDGRPDIVIANDGTSTVGVLLGQASGGFAPVTTYSTGTNSRPNGVAVADVNGDGRPDIVTANNGSNTVGVLLGLAGGGLAPVTTYSIVASPNSSPQPRAVAVADVNGDGRLDILTSNYQTSEVGVLLGQAGGGFAPVAVYSTGGGTAPYGLVVADVNGDGRPDIVTDDYGDDKVSVLLGQASGGFAFGSFYTISLTAASSTSVAVADVNSDGRPDIVTNNFRDNTVMVLLGRASGGFAPVSAYSAGGSGGLRGVAIADVNGDGRLDIVAAGGVSNNVSVLLNTTPLATRTGLAGASVGFWPNPAPAGTTVAMSGAGLPTPAQRLDVTLHNVLGQPVRRLSLPAAGGSLSTAGLVPGLYMVRSVALDAAGTMLGELPTQRLMVK